MGYRVVWFKRDLRVQDHWPLWEAARRGPVLCLYVVEPELWRQPDAAAQHYGFVRESLHVLDQQLQSLGSRLYVAVGEVVDVLAALHAASAFEALHAHEETGNAHTFARDMAVGRWCRARGVAWHEWAQFGVVRRLHDRRDWQPRWEQHMVHAQAPLPEALHTSPLNVPHIRPWDARALPSALELGLDPYEHLSVNAGGVCKRKLCCTNF